MNALLGLIARFGRDDRGAFATLFGILSIVLVAVAGAVVDFTSVQQARTRAQEALDSAALSLQPEIYSETDSQIKATAQKLVVERIADKSITVNIESVATNTTDGTLHLQAQITVPTTFVGLVGVPQIQARLVAEATRKKLYVEVAMVLDNSGSMASYSRMDNLKTAAKNATDILFSNQDTLPNVQVGIVPFTELVNVGTANANASWMDRTGAAQITRDNFDDDDNHTTPFNGPVDRIALFNNFSNVSWGGCVEARKSPYDTTDDPPDSSVPDTLFTPAMMPDAPDSWSTGSGDYISDTPSQCAVLAGSCSCTTTTEPYYDWRGRLRYRTSTDCTKTLFSGGSTSGSNVCSCSSGTTTSSSSGGTTTSTITCPYYDTGSNLPDREKQERLCKYVPGVTVNYSGFYGPNGDCPSAAILPLTNQRSPVKSEIDSMVANGGTNIHEGTIWGWRVLSPGSPFTQGRAYDTATYKVIIMMTDGENTFYPNNSMNGSSLYSAYGFLYNNRLGNMGDSTSTLQADMDTKTLAACTNAKKEGVEIYTIGLQPPNTKTQTMLTNCATDASHAYFPSDPSQLDAVFQDIATKISRLRLAQ